MLSIIIFAVFCWFMAAEVQSSPPHSEYFNSGSEQVFYGNDMIYEQYYGKLSLEYNVNFTFNSQYRICSNSKLFTAVSIMQLVESGKISSIYDNVNKYLNESDMIQWGYPTGTTQWCPVIYGASPTQCQNVTFVALMSMTAGIIPVITCPFNPAEWQYQFCLPPVWSSVYNGSPQVSMQSFVKNPLMWTPGPTYGPNLTSFNSYSYANENFIILSYFVQKLSGMSLQDYFQKNIFDRVGMENTFYDPFSWAFQTQPGLATEYFYYTDLTQTIEPFAVGQCWSVEAKTGTQAGSGGIVSTLPDMIKWYTSLFLYKNASLLSQQSLDLVIYPWALEPVSPGNPYQYYGLGVEMLFDVPITSPPMPVSSAPQPISIYYLGGSECMFFTMMLYLSSYNIMDPSQPLVSVPMIAAVARNNRIMNVTQEVWSAGQQVPSGTWFTVTEYPYGWGQSNSALTDTFFEALDLVMYFGGMPSTNFDTSAPTMAPTRSPSDCTDASFNSNSQGSLNIRRGVFAIAIILPALASALLTYFFVKATTVPGATSINSPVVVEVSNSPISENIGAGIGKV